MKFYMVTWNDDTQFLVDVVDAKSKKDAIVKAIEAHREYDLDNFGPYENRPDSDVQIEDIIDPKKYDVYGVNKMEDLLDIIIRRNDCIGIYKNVIVFD